MLSAYFILAANSWMQHPVGYRFNPDTGRAELTDIGAVLTNSTTLVTLPAHDRRGLLPHRGRASSLGVALWHLVRRHEHVDGHAARRLRLGAWIALVAGARRRASPATSRPRS